MSRRNNNILSSSSLTTNILLQFGQFQHDFFSLVGQCNFSVFLSSLNNLQMKNNVYYNRLKKGLSNEPPSRKPKNKISAQALFQAITVVEIFLVMQKILPSYTKNHSRVTTLEQRVGEKKRPKKRPLSFEKRYKMFSFNSPLQMI